ncbi:hypothetical protein ACSQ67_008326 [Phaseolus vulgaris]
MRSVGCFVTHSWLEFHIRNFVLRSSNSCNTILVDQQTNAKLISYVWKTGIRALVDEKKVVQRETLKHCIKKIMEGCEEMKTNAIQWRNLAVRALSEGGSSYENVKEFANQIYEIHKLHVLK